MTEAGWLACDDPVPMLEAVRPSANDRKLRLFSVACCRRVWDLFAFPSGRRAVEVAELYADRAVSEGDRQVAFVVAATEAARWVNNCSILHNAIGYIASAAAFVLANEDTAEVDVSAAGAGDVVTTARACHHEVEWLGSSLVVALDTAAGAGAAVVAHFDERERAAAGESAGYQAVERQTLVAGAAIAESLGMDLGPALAVEYDALFGAARRAEGAAQSRLLRCIFGTPFRPAGFAPTWRSEAAVALARRMYESRDFAAMPDLADALSAAGCADPDVLAHCRGSGPYVRGCWVVDLLLGKE